MEFDGLDLTFAQREMFESAVAMGRAALKAVGSRAGRGRPRRARISAARLRAARTAEPRPATCTPGRSGRSVPTGRCRRTTVSPTRSRKAVEPARVDVAFDERLADAAGEDQGQPAGAVLLVARHPARRAGRPSGEPDVATAASAGPQLPRCAATRSASAARHSPSSAEKRNASAMPSATASPWSMVPRPASALDRMGEAVAEIEQRALARPVFDVAGDDPRLGRDRGGDGVVRAGRGWPARRPRAIGLAPGEEGRVVDQPIFDDLGIAGAQLALRRACRGRQGRR